MSGCPTHGQLVGGYVLGALDSAEMEGMRRHATSCPECAAEVRELRAVPALLERIEPADVPPPMPSAEVEQGLLDRVARARAVERGAAAAGRPRRPPVAVRAAVVVVACAVALLVVLAQGADEAEPPYAHVDLVARATSLDARGEASVEAVPAGTRVTLRARELAAGVEYELWCVRGDGRWVSGGTFRADERGDAAAELTAAVRPGDYHVMVVTRHTGARDPVREPAVLRGELEY